MTYERYESRVNSRELTKRENHLRDAVEDAQVRVNSIQRRGAQDLTGDVLSEINGHAIMLGLIAVALSDWCEALRAIDNKTAEQADA